MTEQEGSLNIYVQSIALSKATKRRRMWHCKTWPRYV